MKIDFQNDLLLSSLDVSSEMTISTSLEAMPGAFSAASCNGTLGTLGTAGTIGGCAGTLGTAGSYGCGE